MVDIVTYDYLWQAYQKEKQTNQLLLIPKNFYDEILLFIDDAKTNDHDINTADNTIRLLNDFYEKRKQKMLIYIAYNKQIPQPISNNEIEFYNKVLKTVKAEKIDFASKVKNNTRSIKSMKDVPEIILPSGNKIGPLTKDQTIEELSEQDRSYLVENSICEEI